MTKNALLVFSGAIFSAFLLTCGPERSGDNIPHVNAQRTVNYEYAALTTPTTAAPPVYQLVGSQTEATVVPGCESLPNQPAALLCGANALGGAGWDCAAISLGQAWCKRPRS